MRIVVHDYSGHPFQIQLSRELARRGHVVQHVYFADFQTPKGALSLRADDPSTLTITGVSLGEPFRKNTFVQRRSQEIRYGKQVADIISAFQPDVVFSSNSPLDAQRLIQKAARAAKDAAFVFWVQDLYGEAIRKILTRKLHFVGALIAAYYLRLERTLLSRSAHVICISSDFETLLRGYGVDAGTVTVIENWAPLEDMPLLPKDNAWSRKVGLSKTGNIVYSGTLGYKHNPDLLLRLALETDGEVNVFSEGAAADWLRLEAGKRGLSNLKVHPWVSFEDLPAMLASADIAVAIIEPDAGIYSVPSKVLTYMSVGRAILASIPPENLAARILARETAGLVAPPADAEVFVDYAKKLLADSALREQLGANARSYAENKFDIRGLGDRFEGISIRAMAKRGRVGIPADTVSAAV